MSTGARKDVLNRDAIFYLACREAFRGGGVGSEENQLLNRLRRWLEVGGETARRLGAAAKKEARSNPGRAGARLTPGTVYHQSWRFALRKGSLTGAEESLLAELAAFLELPESVAAEARDLAAAERLGGRSLTGDRGAEGESGLPDSASAISARPVVPAPEPDPVPEPEASPPESEPEPAPAPAAPPPESPLNPSVIAEPPPEAPARPLIVVTFLLFIAAAGQVAYNFTMGYTAGAAARRRQEQSEQRIATWRKHVETSREHLSRGDGVRARAELDRALEFCDSIPNPVERYFGLGLTHRQLMLTRMEELRKRPAGKPFGSRLEAEVSVARIVDHAEQAIVYLKSLESSADAAQALAGLAKEYGDFLEGIGRGDAARRVRGLVRGPASDPGPHTSGD